jgi:hypothetical protein
MNKFSRLRCWQEFKRLALKFKPDSVVYRIEQNGFSPQKELTCLRLIMPTQDIYYVFLDFPKGQTLRETEIPLRKDRQGNNFIEEKDVEDFLKNQLGEHLNVYSYWTI